MDISKILYDPSFWVFIAFVIFFIALGKTLWRALVNALDARSAKIADELTKAQTLREEAEALLARYRDQYNEAVKQSEEMLSKAKADAALLTENYQKELRQALDKRLESTKENISRAEKDAVQAVQSQMVEMTIAATMLLLREQFEKSGNDAYLDNALAKLDKTIH